MVKLSDVKKKSVGGQQSDGVPLPPTKCCLTEDDVTHLFIGTMKECGLTPKLHDLDYVVKDWRFGSILASRLAKHVDWNQVVKEVVYKSKEHGT